MRFHQMHFSIPSSWQHAIISNSHKVLKIDVPGHLQWFNADGAYGNIADAGEIGLKPVLPEPWMIDRMIALTGAFYLRGLKESLARTVASAGPLHFVVERLPDTLTALVLTSQKDPLAAAVCVDIGSIVVCEA